MPETRTAQSVFMKPTGGISGMIGAGGNQGNGGVGSAAVPAYLPPPPPLPTQAAPTPSMVDPTTLTSKTDISPYLKQQLGRYNDRFSVDNTKRAIQKSTSGIMDSAALAAADLKSSNLARRGLVGSGAGTSFLSKRVFEPAQRDAAKAASDISLGREQQLDNLVLGGTALATAPDSIAATGRGLNIAQYQAQEGAAQARAKQAQDQADQGFSQWLALARMSMNGTTPNYSQPYAQGV